MSEKLSIHGKITVELIKKNGKREIHEENMLTDFGKAYAMANGLNKLMFSDTTNYQSRLKNYGGSYPSYSSYKDGTHKLFNVLLSMTSSITAKDGVKGAKSGELVAYAYRSTTPTSQEGTTSPLSDNDGMTRNISKRFSYSTDTSGTITHVGIMTSSPDGSIGAIVPAQLGIAPGATSDTILTKYMPGYACGLTGNKLCINPNSSGIVVDLDTGEVGNTGYVDGQTIGLNTFKTWFKYGNYTYVWYDSGTNYASQAYADVYDNSDGSLKYTAKAYGPSVNNYYCSVVYDDEADEVYLIVSNDSNQHRKYVLSTDSDGVLKFDNDYTTISTWIKGLRPVSDGSKTINMTRDGVVYDGKLNKIANLINYQKTGINPGVIFNRAPFFMIDGQLLSFTLDNVSSPTEMLLQYFGNLISIHQFSNPIQKSVGDQLYITYSYTAN